MVTDKRQYETGSEPYYLNTDNTAKDFSYGDLTNPDYGFLDTLTKFVIIEDNVEIIDPIILDDVVIPEDH